MKPPAPRPRNDARWAAYAERTTGQLGWLVNGGSETLVGSPLLSWDPQECCRHCAAFNKSDLRPGGAETTTESAQL
jgi:hypothetical protein